MFREEEGQKMLN